MIFARKKLDAQAGFTLPELITVVALSALFVSLILMFGMSYWRYGILLESDSDTLVTRLNAQDFIREQIGTSSGLIIQNSIADTHTNNPDPAIPSGHFWVPLHAVPSTTASGGSGTTPLLYYKRFSTNTSGAFIMNGTQPYDDEFVLYLDKDKKQILVRTLANPAASGNRLKTSCPPSSATPACPADKIIVSDLASVTLGYFSRSGNPIDWTSIFDPLSGTYAGPDYPTVEVLEVTLKLSVKPVFQKTNATQNTTVIRIALRNT